MNNVLSQIELGISKANFSMWFKDTFIIKQDDGVVHLGVPNVFVKDWLMNKYHKDILKNLIASFRYVFRHVFTHVCIITKTNGYTNIKKFQFFL